VTTIAVMRLLATLLAVPLLAAASLGDYIDQPTTGYTAERQVRLGSDMQMTETVYAMPDRERVERSLGGMKTVTVIRRDLGEAWMWTEGQPFFNELPLAKVDAHSRPFATLSVEEIGSDTVDGLATTKYRLEGEDEEGMRMAGHFWMTPENIIVRVEMQTHDPERGPMSFAQQIRSLALGDQPAALFERPANLQPNPMADIMREMMPGGIPGMGGQAAGQGRAASPQQPPDPEAMARQMQQFQKQMKQVQQQIQQMQKSPEFQQMMQQMQQLQKMQQGQQ